MESSGKRYWEAMGKYRLCTRIFTKSLTSCSVGEYKKTLLSIAVAKVQIFPHI